MLIWHSIRYTKLVLKFSWCNKPIYDKRLSMRYFALILTSFCVQINLAQDVVNNPLLSEDPIQQQKWVDSLYNSMSINERIGQLYMVQVMSENSDKVNNKVVNLIKNQHIGGVIYSNGGPYRQAKLNNKLQAASKIPLLIGMV